MPDLNLLAFNVKQAFEGEKFDRALSWLPTEEHPSVLRYKFDKDKHLALASLLLRRYYFSKKLNISWHDLKFGRLSAGKPYLMNGEGHFDFNTSHEGDWVIFGCVVAQNMKIGVDAVSIVPPKSGTIDEFIECFQPQLTQGEMQMIKKNNQDETARLKTFYQLWGCKESYAKALGLGLSLELNKVEFTSENNKINIKFEGETLKGWNFHISYLDTAVMAVICYGRENSTHLSPASQHADLLTQPTVLFGDTCSSSPKEKKGSVFTFVSFEDVEQKQSLYT
ncbi:4'-phosphopantetheinyl transferase superfamily [Mycotypha africana]|uniref:4'-phosphopantetheinyl transferase superfamily n=1 Tax=Mycotypha africana TaxID=64632 RepID=UPI002300CDD1|nr:4'-phosphopantetheinyl transferase superfamily [Mycotypha africana]KAI8971526.1 4'-phosphopantetheinyl transferase superfamily [Mycotypha africana]